LGISFIYIYTKRAPLTYKLPNIEKKETDIRQLESLISAFFPMGKSKTNPERANIQFAPSYFKVIGYILGEPSAVILKYKRSTFVLTEGESQKGIKLLKVTTDYVLLEYNGKTLKVNIKKGKTEKRNSKYVENKVGNTKIISKALVEQLTQNYGQLLTQVDFTPYLRNGKTEGFRIRWIAPNSIITKLGFKQGDVILSVNDIPIRNTEDIFRIVQIIRNEPSLRVEILRNGERKTLEIKIE
jgi:general secretion pathway protein C